jgi:hypothetical protein
VSERPLHCSPGHSRGLSSDRDCGNIRGRRARSNVILPGRQHERQSTPQHIQVSPDSVDLRVLIVPLGDGGKPSPSGEEKLTEVSEGRRGRRGTRAEHPPAEAGGFADIRTRADLRRLKPAVSSGRSTSSRHLSEPLAFEARVGQSSETRPASVAVVNMDDAGDQAEAAALCMLIIATNVVVRLLFELATWAIRKRTQRWRMG